jgi:hypothetical protein
LATNNLTMFIPPMGAAFHAYPASKISSILDNPQFEYSWSSVPCWGTDDGTHTEFLCAAQVIPHDKQSGECQSFQSLLSWKGCLHQSELI